MNLLVAKCLVIILVRDGDEKKKKKIQAVKYVELIIDQQFRKK